MAGVDHRPRPAHRPARRSVRAANSTRARWREFQDADRRHIETTAQRVRRLAAEQAVAAEEEQTQQGMLIRDQAARKRGHLSIRQLFSGAPDMLTALKPCWAMSPLVVSQLLPADQPYFDVVVFDEASQVRPAEAIPAILRGRQLVVAGDERQLPPTAFFTGASAEDDDETMIGRVVVDSGYEIHPRSAAALHHLAHAGVALPQPRRAAHRLLQRPPLRLVADDLPGRARAGKHPPRRGPVRRPASTPARTAPPPRSNASST